MSEQRIASCLHKAAFPTRNLARAALRRLTKRAGVKLEIYRCGFCPNYHIGSTERKR